MCGILELEIATLYMWTNKQERRAEGGGGGGVV